MSKIGLVDIGSNTVRLVIYKTKADLDYRILLNTKESVRLRNHVKDGFLTEEGIQKLFTVLKQYTRIAKKYDLDEFRLFATQTVRMVKNKIEIIDRVEERFDLRIDVLTKDEESLLGFKGMHTYLDHQKHGVYVDLGGGSIEIVHFENNQPKNHKSLDFGSIVLRNMISHAIPTKDEIAYLNSYLHSEFDSLPWLRNLKLPLVVVGGSSRNLVRIDAFLTKRRESTHGYKLGFREIQRIRKILMLLNIEEIENIDGFTASRADIIIPSIYVFECLYKYINATYYRCSRTGLREGVLLDILGG